MFPRHHRLRSSGDILQVIRRGHKVSTSYVNIFWQSGDSRKGLRFACIAGKKISPSAVKRHRFQRWMRAAAREVLPPIGPPYDMVWVARPGMVSCKSLNELRQVVTPAIKKANLS